MCSSARRETLKRNKMACSFHNHAVEFQTKDGLRPIDILAQSKDLVFHVDVEVCRRRHRSGGLHERRPGKTNACCSRKVLSIPTPRSGPRQRRHTLEGFFAAAETVAAQVLFVNARRDRNNASGNGQERSGTI